MTSLKELMEAVGVKSLERESGCSLKVMLIIAE